MAGQVLKIKDLYKSFKVGKDEIPVLQNISLEFRKGEFVTIVGHSGCGKSTLLKIIAGLVEYETGEVTYGEKRITAPGTDRGMVFQEHRLLPWLTIEENIGFGLFSLSKEKKKAAISKHVELVRLNGFEKAYPSQLSGGMAQRAAIARGLASNPEILLLDEPFGALDALTRIQMQKEILRIWKEEKTTMIMVTHDIDEAIFLGQKVVVMSARPGEIKEIIDVNTATVKDRGSTEFAHIKKRIYNHFFEDENMEIEYVI
ncbi:aliphatic sulfonates import ATP-binding protein SsuB [Ruminiclostridium hungatei]|uniref:Aliphatic sulfonates import ATP-binding protein SsuB n=1 Tax=Ruminiclostridium hungatei TaxID=48256 RepID=A0A1V4SHB1_RUMHU|nr:ABC transporter ATP-binding protein [Ruminiclostridium hungatei]OPX43279.1 aliphatic sulfonates import ATP-binding protein SsuB [Ruminiclostridium hungatei]